MIPEDYEAVAARLAVRDEFYQTMRQQFEANEDAFCGIRENLSKADREALDLYVAAGEAMEYRKGQLTAAHYAIHGARIFKTEDNF